MINTIRIALLGVIATLAASATAATAESVAPTPPMGWNSWDAYGLTINESDFKANAAVLAALRHLGWMYAVIDEGWYMDNPSGTKLEQRRYQLDAHGLLIPAINRFPSSAAGAGLAPLAGWIHARGLKFGLHIVRGIPKQAVRDDLPIAKSKFHATDAADTADVCPWDDGNYGVRDNAAGQAYYDSMLKLYAAWGLDFIKVDCIADHPYKATEIRQIATAIQRTGRPIVLSLSPGPAQLSHAAEIARQAQMWRISNDIWDGWSFTHSKPGDDFPNGVMSAFDNLARWAPYAKPGNWPDADMLPFGSLRPSPGWGPARDSRLSHDEQQTQFVLWAVARSPLILGGNLTHLDELTRSLVSNRDLLEVNQKSASSHPVDKLPPGFENIRVWAAAGTQIGQVVAIFNVADGPQSIQAAWAQFGLAGGKHMARNLLEGRMSSDSQGIDLTLPAHGCAVYRLD